jgi:hypothetical protein
MGGVDCELVGDGWLAQPVNAWSSLAYLAAAAFVVRGRRGAFTVLGAAALVLVGVGSFAYHGPQPRWAEAVHDLSIVALLAAVAVRLRWRPPAVAVAAIAVGTALYVLGRTEGPLCSPSSVVQLHAGWHVATAIAAAAVLSQAPAVAGHRWRAGSTACDDDSGH